MQPITSRLQKTVYALQKIATDITVDIRSASTLQEIQKDTALRHIALPLDALEYYYSTDGFDVRFCCEGVACRLLMYQLSYVYVVDAKLVFSECAHGRFALDDDGVWLLPVYYLELLHVAKGFHEFYTEMLNNYGVSGWYFGAEYMSAQALLVVQYLAAQKLSNYQIQYIK